MANSDLLTGNLRKVFPTPNAGPGARNDDPPTANPWARPRGATGTPQLAEVETDEGVRIVDVSPVVTIRSKAETEVIESIEALSLDDAAPARLPVEIGYEGLAKILDEALAQAQSGKGRERHQQRALQRFEDQPMQRISDLLDTNAGMAFQAIKKLTEAAAQIARGNAEAGIRDLLGTIVYTAGIILRTRAKG